MEMPRYRATAPAALTFVPLGQNLEIRFAGLPRASLLNCFASLCSQLSGATACAHGRMPQRMRARWAAILAATPDVLAVQAGKRVENGLPKACVTEV